VSRHPAARAIARPAERAPIARPRSDEHRRRRGPQFCERRKEWQVAQHEVADERLVDAHRDHGVALVFLDDARIGGILERVEQIRRRRHFRPPAIARSVVA
jgi:hypothetical protein